MTALGSRESRGTDRANPAWTSRYSAGVRTSINSTGCPLRHNSSSSVGVIVRTLITPSLRSRSAGPAVPVQFKIALDSPELPCYDILGRLVNYIPDWLSSQAMTALIPD